MWNPVIALTETTDETVSPNRQQLVPQCLTEPIYVITVYKC